MRLWPELRDGGWLLDILGDKSAAAYWKRIFGRTYANQIESWAYRWTFACWAQSGLTILPNDNLVTNIGFGDAATNTTEQSKLAEISTLPMVFPLRHPEFMIRDTVADDYTQRRHYGTSNPLRYTLGRIKHAARRQMLHLLPTRG